ncbi:lipase secretion chaperone [Vogesella sp. DC21W]|uniref:Lipase helper protein n=1 Tax=Vogesella aquatica TaxID=2984206 RepID=A0ABT5J0J1_9NEIS|nr:lipase secretion chaperone [Vogesella aquatica]MDC7718312.1 lipase secretion chaperone [Vogesella aquatica]
MVGHRKAWLLLPVLLLVGAWWWPGGDGPLSAQEEVFAPSLRQTAVDGLAGAAGSSVMTRLQLKALFDYYLSTLGERSLDDIRHEILLQLEKRLSGPALADAQDLLRRYLGYQHALADLGKGMAGQAQTLDTMAARLQAVQQTRSRYFGAQEIAELFGHADVLDRFVLQRTQIMQRADLSAAEKQKQIAQLEAGLPAQQQQWRRQATRHITLAESEQALLQQGGSASDLQALRAAEVGPEAAERLAAVDRENQAWNARLVQWKLQRQAIASDVALSPAQRQQAEQALQQKLFSETEQRRLLAYQ